jgi:hypothetical protein
MSSAIERPVFFLGQYVGPDDLDQTVEYHRGQLARHERGLHLPGIASGLVLSINSGVLNVSAGMAVDIQGREIVVAEDETVEPAVFIDANVFVKDAWHPVFLELTEEDPPVSPFSTGACDVAQRTRKLEGHSFSFGKPGDETPSSTVAPLPGEGADPDAASPLHVLVGFVTWDDTNNQFLKAADNNGTTRVQFCGVRADEVVARGGKLTLRAKAVEDKGQAVAELDESDPKAGPMFRFGLQGETSVKPLFTIDKNGTVWAAGKLTSPVTLNVESGTITDGMPLPLPAGVTDDDLDSGKAQLHVLLTPRIPLDDGGFGAGARIPVAHKCEVNGRAVTCQIRWISNTLGPADELRPGSCDYLVETYATPAKSS